MSTQAKPKQTTSAEGGFANRLSPLIAALGVTAVPDLLIRYQGRLRLTSNELVYLLHVLAHRREGACWPWVAASDVAHRTGAGERSVRDWRASIVKKGYLVLHARGNTGSPGGGRLSDEHDLSPLFATLEALALEETIQQATLQARRDLPAPTYFCGMPNMPQLTRSDRRRLQSRRAHPGRGKYAETDMEPPTPSMQKTAGSTLPVPARSTMPEPAEETEDLKQKLLTPPTPKGAQGVDEKRSGTVLKPDDSFQPALPGTAAVGLPAPGCRDPGEELLAAFYRGLGTDIGGLTQTVRRREMKIACDLIAVGATPAEAEAYAREASAIPGRIAAVDLRAFERERLSWLGRRQRVGTAPLLRVANGRVPD